MIRRFIFLLLLACMATLAVRAYVVEGIYVASASMEPTMPVGVHLFLEKITIKFGRLKRGDIVVFPSPSKKNHDLIKRVIALPGDELEIRDKTVYLNGRQQQETYVKFTRKDERLEGDNLGPMTIPEGMVFVMGDNRDESDDGRVWKDEKTGQPIYFVPIDEIKGKALWAF
jgi:signal peptidase I